MSTPAGRRPRKGPLRDAFPITYAFGDRHRPLTPEAAVGATPDERIRSIWPFLVRRVLNFQATLSARERANFDLEDTLAELFIALRDRDAKWRPEQGRYITFAGRVVDHELISIRERARTVESPRNCTCRVREYTALAARGELSDASGATLRAMLRSMRDAAAIESARERWAEDESLAAVDDAEAADALRTAVVRAVIGLSTAEARAVGLSTGLWTGEPRSLRAVAALMGVSTVKVASLLQSGLAKIAARLTIDRSG
jgi:DNA-directed RNA polymerase specialized sigma24 family protein